jgi:DNA-binding GntR family transcriptional regulator
MKISERIQEHIESEIRAGNLNPGDLIDEMGLARHFQVSRTPVREALLRLEAQCVVVSVPRQGMFVAKLSVRQLLAIWELLAEMEGLCARLACERMTAQERDQLVAIHQRAEQHVQSGDTVSWLKANHAFHQALYQGSRNPHLEQEILQLRARITAYLQYAFKALSRLNTSHAQHAIVLKAILEADSATAYDTMVKHVGLERGTRGLADFIINLPSSLLRN